MESLARLVIISTLVLSLNSVAQPATAVVGGCKASTIKYSTESTPATTTSITFKDVPNTALEFRTRRSGDRCLIVRFSVEAYPGSNGDFFVQVLLDGLTQAQPGVVRWGDFSMNVVPASFEFIFPGPISPGDHEVKVQWRAQQGNPATFGARSLTVTH